ncbi:unnamed protein product [Victoria cruziana]
MDETTTHGFGVELLSFLLLHYLMYPTHTVFVGISYLYYYDHTDSAPASHVSIFRLKTMEEERGNLSGRYIYAAIAFPFMSSATTNKGNTSYSISKTDNGISKDQQV